MITALEIKTKSNRTITTGEDYTARNLPKTMDHLAVVGAEDYDKITHNLSESGHTLVKTSLYKGYVSVKNMHICYYKGRYGEGYAIFTHSYSTSKYCVVEYFIKENENA